MFDEEVIKLIIKGKEAEIQELQNTQPVNQDAIDTLEAEINYLKALLIRYEIAKLLGLDSDPKYRSMGFLGIEEENVADFNLSPADMTMYNSLIAQLPREQLIRYKVRREMANVLGEEIGNNFKDNDYAGIEEINPNLTKYDLDQDQIKKFNDLVTRLNSISDDTTKNVNINSETINLLKDTFNKLNIEDIDEYNRIKDTYFEALEKLIEKVDNNTKNELFGGVSNYEFASDLKEKYSDSTIKLDLAGVEKLLIAIENPTLDEDKYNEYIELLSTSINSLYENDVNKAAIENLVNDVNNANYILRSDLNSRLNKMENADLGLKDNELENFIIYLDQNYSSLSDRERDRYFDLVRAKVSVDVDDVNKVESVNSLLTQINNKDLSIKLQNALSGKDMAKFNDKHLTSYDSLLQSTINKLNSQVSYCKNRKSGSAISNAFYDTKQKELEKEIAQLEAIRDKHQSNALLEGLDSSYNSKTDRIIELNKDIADLKELRNDITSTFHKKLIDRKIEKKQREINRLKKSKNKIVGMQKRLMIPKIKLHQKKGFVGRHFDAKGEVFNDYAKDYEKMAETERQLSGMLSGIKAKFYDLQAKRYKTKAEFNHGICGVLKKSKIVVHGNNQHMVNRNALNHIRQNQQQQLQQAQNQQQMVQTA